MRQSPAQCHKIELIGDGVRAHFRSEMALAPGQFALARLAAAFDPYLRRALFPAAISAAGFAVDVLPSDPALQWLVPGAEAEVIGPCGSAAPALSPRSRVLLIADRDPAPLLPFAAGAIAGDGTATLLLDRPYPLDALDPQIEVRVGPLPPLAAELAPAADHVFLYAHDALRRSVHHSLAGARPGAALDNVQALAAPAMPCGVGACGACAVKTGRGWKLACMDGPFFSLAELDA